MLSFLRRSERSSVKSLQGTMMIMNMEKSIFGRMANRILILFIVVVSLLGFLSGADNLETIDHKPLQLLAILTPMLLADRVKVQFFKPYSGRHSRNGSEGKQIKRRCRRGKQKRIFLFLHG